MQCYYRATMRILKTYMEPLFEDRKVITLEGSEDFSSWDSQFTGLQSELRCLQHPFPYHASCH